MTSISGAIGEIGFTAGTAAILNVGDGDTKLSFDPSKPEERARAAKVVAQMLRAGFSIMIEVDNGKDGKVFKRVKTFKPDVCEYIISGEPDAQAQSQAAPATSGKGRRGSARKPADVSVPAIHTRAVGIARSAGG